MTTVDHTTMETYLRGVVPAESISSWPAATLQAQAIAARSYSAWHRAACRLARLGRLRHHRLPGVRR
nr:SpoIID/LytB domain-containing protein [Angustibacter aerolatus]